MEIYAGRVSRIWVRSIILLLLLGGLLATFRVAAGQQNAIQAENARPGTTNWQLSNPAKNQEIEGYASATSVNRGGQISFFVSTVSPSFTIAIYRLGWYGGLGGRQEMAPVQLPGVDQPMPSPDPDFFMVECNWTSSFTLTTSNPSDPTDWASGVYVAKIKASSGKDQYIIFVLLDDSSSSSLVYQQSVNTFQAYNGWGGTSLYSSNPRAVKVSFNRPYDDGWGTGLFLSYEFDMVAFLESEGYDVTYTTDVDTHERGNLLTNHRGFLSVGHNEYWSKEMRDRVTAARDAGVGLGFFAANECYWQIRYETSPITGVPDRTIVAYKETANQADPDASNPATYDLVTTRWRDNHVTLPGQPEDSLIGIMYLAEEPATGDVVVENTANTATSWVFANTGLNDGDHLPGILGYEVDALTDDSSTPANIFQIAHSPFVLNGRTFAGDSSVYQAPSGAWVFAGGSIQWDWGLNNISPWGPTSSQVNAGTQQITRNVLNAFINSESSTPSPSPTATVTSTPKPTATPTPKPTPIPVVTPQPTPRPTPVPTATPRPTPSPTPGGTIVLSANPVIFPNAGLHGAPTHKSFLIHNLSIRRTLVGNVGSPVSFFSFVSGGGNFNIPPGGTQTVKMLFTPTGLGLEKSLLVIASNDRLHPSITVNLLGTGEPGVPSLSIPARLAPPNPLSMTFGAVGIGIPQTPTLSLRINNVGLGELGGTVGALAPPFAIGAGGGAFGPI